MWAKPQEVTPICLFILVTVGDDPHTPNGQHGLKEERTTSGETLELNQYRAILSLTSKPRLGALLRQMLLVWAMRRTLLSLKDYLDAEDKDIQRLGALVGVGGLSFCPKRHHLTRALHWITYQRQAGLLPKDV